MRNLTGLSDIEIADNQLDQIISDAQNTIEAYTGKSWEPSETEYSKIQTATRLLVASLCFESLPSTPETKEKAQYYHDKVMAILEAMDVDKGSSEIAFKVVQA